MDRVGVFDSGVGGLSVVREIMAQLPASRSSIWPTRRTRPTASARWTRSARCRKASRGSCSLRAPGVIVIACNTASAAALHGLRAQVPRRAVRRHGAGGEARRRAHPHRPRGGHGDAPRPSRVSCSPACCDRFGADVAVHTQICPELVPLVEAGELDTERARAAVRSYVGAAAGGRDRRVGAGLHALPVPAPPDRGSGGPGRGHHRPGARGRPPGGRVLAQHGWLAPPSTPPDRTFFTTGDAGRFAAALYALLGHPYTAKQAAWMPGGLQ